MGRAALQCRVNAALIYEAHPTAAQWDESLNSGHSLDADLKVRSTAHTCAAPKTRD